jgi:hypothetical protein
MFGDHFRRSRLGMRDTFGMLFTGQGRCAEGCQAESGGQTQRYPCVHNAPPECFCVCQQMLMLSF